MKNAFAILLIISSLTLFGLPLQEHSALKAEALETVTGIVIDATSRQPIAGADVLIMQPGDLKSRLTAKSAADGTFQVDNVSDGKIMLAATKEGYSSQTAIEPLPERGFPVLSARNNRFRLSLTAYSEIRGRITVKGGQPAVGFVVTEYHEKNSEGVNRWEAGPQVATTDLNGEYRFNTLPSGRYRIFCSGATNASTKGDGPAVIVPVYYPSALSLDTAQTIVLQAGEHKTADSVMPMERGYPVTGIAHGLPEIVSAEPNSPFPSALVQITNLSGNPLSGKARFDLPTGRFAFDAIPSGKWKIALSVRIGSEWATTSQAIAVDHAPVGGVQLVFHQPHTIQVVVNLPVAIKAKTAEKLKPHSAQSKTDLPQQDVLDAMEDALIFNPGLRVDLVPANSAGVSPAGMTINFDPPAFVFENVAAGRYKLNAEVKNGGCIDAAWYGNVDLLRDSFEIDPNSKAEQIVINVTTQCATLKPMLPASESSRRLFMVAVPMFSSAMPICNLISPAKSTVHDAESTLPPGEYQLYYFSSLDNLDFSSRDTLKPFAHEVVDLRAGKRTELAVDPALIVTR